MVLHKIFHALNRYVCRQVLDQLRGGPKSVAEITAQVKHLGRVSRPAISQALALLLDAGLVARHRKGRLHYYQLRAAGFKDLARYAQGLLDRAWQ